MDVEYRSELTYMDNCKSDINMNGNNKHSTINSR